MFDRFLTRLADLVTSRRSLVIGGVVVFTLFCAAQLPYLQTDTAPENLIISYGGYQERIAAFRERFGDTDSVVALLLETDDATQHEPLRYLHRLSRHFSGEPYVARVESLTVTPLPGVQRPAQEESLEDLDDLGSLADEPPVDPAIEAALSTLIASDPARFPMGLITIAERVGDSESDTAAAVRGEDVTAEEAAAIRAALPDLPLVLGQLVSEDRTVTACVIYLDPSLGAGDARRDALAVMDDWLAQNPPPAGVRLHTAGIPHLRDAISDHMQEDQIFLVPLTLLVCLLLLYSSFRWLPGTILPLIVVGMTVLQVLGLMALFGEPMTVLMNVLPTLLIILGLEDSVHLIGRYGEELRRTPDRRIASRDAMKHMAVACFFTSFTNAVGLASNVLSQTDMMRRFSIVGGLGVMLAYVGTVCFTPAAVTFFHPPTHRKPEGAASEYMGRGVLEKGMLHLTKWVLAHPWWVIVPTMLASIPCWWAATHLRVDTALLDTFDPDDPIAISTRLIEERLDGVRPLEVVLSAEDEGRLRDPDVLAALSRVETWAREEEGVLHATGPNDYLWETWRRIAGIDGDEPQGTFASRAQVEALGTLLGRLDPSPLDSYTTPDGRHARLEIRIGDIGAQRSIRLLDRIEGRVADELEHVPGVHFELLGEAYIGSHGIDSIAQDMLGSILLSCGVVFGALLLLWRSVRLVLLSIPPNVLPLLLTMAWMYFREIPLDASTAIVYSVAVGVAVNGTIHVFARLMEEEERGLLRRAAIMRAARGTGRSIVVSTLSLSLGFTVLMLSAFVPVRHFGELIAVTMTFALISSIVFQPAMLAVFGGKKPLVKRKAPPLP